MALQFNRSFNVGKVISRLITGVLSLYVGGTILTEFGTAMNGTASPLYTGLTLIGWTVATAACPTVSTANCITATTGSGVLSVIGILVIAQVIMEFISF